MDNADSKLERGDESICDTIRGTSADERIRHELIYTDYLTPSALGMDWAVLSCNIILASAFGSIGWQILTRREIWEKNSAVD